MTLAAQGATSPIRQGDQPPVATAAGTAVAAAAQPALEQVAQGVGGAGGLQPARAVEREEVWSTNQLLSFKELAEKGVPLDDGIQRTLAKRMTRAWQQQHLEASDSRNAMVLAPQEVEMLVQMARQGAFTGVQVALSALQGGMAPRSLAALPAGAAPGQARRQLAFTERVALTLLAERGFPIDAVSRRAVVTFVSYQWEEWRKQSPEWHFQARLTRAARPAVPPAVRECLADPHRPAGHTTQQALEGLRRLEQGALEDTGRGSLRMLLPAAWIEWLHSPPPELLSSQQTEALLQMVCEGSSSEIVDAASKAFLEENRAAEWARWRSQVEARQAQVRQEPLGADFRPIDAGPARARTASCSSMLLLFTAVWISGLVLWTRGGTDTLKKVGQVAFGAGLPLATLTASYSSSYQNRQIRI